MKAPIAATRWEILARAASLADSWGNGDAATFIGALRDNGTYPGTGALVFIIEALLREYEQFTTAIGQFLTSPLDGQVEDFPPELVEKVALILMDRYSKMPDVYPKKEP